MRQSDLRLGRILSSNIELCGVAYPELRKNNAVAGTQPKTKKFNKNLTSKIG